MLFTEGEIGAELAHLYNGSSGSVGETEGGEGGQGQSHTKLFVGQIPRGVDQAYLLPFFSSFGVVSELSVIRDKNDPTSPHQGAAFVTYKTMEAAALAVVYPRMSSSSSSSSCPNSGVYSSSLFDRHSWFPNTCPP